MDSRSRGTFEQDDVRVFPSTGCVRWPFAKILCALVTIIIADIIVTLLQKKLRKQHTTG